VTATSVDGLSSSSTITYTVLAPQNRFTVKSVRANRKGAITVSLSSLPEPGTVTVTERATKVPQFTVHETVGSKPTLKFTVPASKRLKGLLKRGGVTVRLPIAYTPTNGIARDLVTSTHLK
jgi:hypothetical protein